MTVRILFVATLAVGLLMVGCGRNTPPKPPSPPPTGVTLIGPCLPKCGSVEQR